MQFKPILFSTPMVQAILEGRKTQTRRVIKELARICDADDWDEVLLNGSDWDAVCDTSDGLEVHTVKCPHGKVGDVLWVKEAHFRYGKWAKNGITKTGKQKWRFVPDTGFPNVRYMDDPPVKVQKISDRVTGWYKRSSLFMPKSACRIFLQITDIRVERLQDISEEDARAEGVKIKQHFKETGDWTAKAAFQLLWQSINGPESWSANPWVWAITFNRIDKPSNF